MIVKKEAVRGFLFLYVQRLACVLGGFLLLTMIGCASTDSKDFRQVTFVTSEPTGAEIFDGETRLGVTPAYVRIRRSHHPHITLKMNGQEKVIPLETHYRWADSFGANFIMLTLAPIGWAIDWGTGTAWRMDDPRIETFVVKNKKPFQDPVELVAVAPPAVDDPALAEALGPILEEKIRASGKFGVLAYKDTEPLFEYYGSTQGLTKNKKEKYSLIYETKADHLLMSKAEQKGDSFLVTADLESIYTGQSKEHHVWEISPDQTTREHVSEHTFFNSYFHLLPNTMFLNLSSFSSSISLDGTEYRGASARNHGFANQVFDYVSFLGFAHLNRPREGVRAHWVLDFVPTANISNKKIRYDDYKPLQGVEFDRWYLSGGYGLELGHESYIGFFYFDFIPTVTWTQLKFETPTFSESASRTAILFSGEFGYRKFLTHHWVGKVFVRTLSEDTTLWERSVRDATGGHEIVDSASSIVAGFAIGYYIPSSLDNKTGWKVHDKK